MSFKKGMMAASVALVMMSTGAMADEKVLHVYNWSDYIAPDTLENFQKETGIKVVYDVFDSNEVLEAKLLAGKSGYDIVVPSNPFLAKQIKAGVFQKLDKSKLSTGRTWTSTCSRRSNRATGQPILHPLPVGHHRLCLQPEKVKAVLGADAPVDSWDLVFKPENMAKLKECGVSFLDSPTEMLPAALQYLGFKPDSQKPDELKKAEALFLSIRPYTAYFHSSKYISDLANGNLCVAVGYSGDLQQSKARAAEAKNGVSLTYTIPKEGAGSFFDMIAIPADAKNVEAAHTFINYLMKPDVIANITNVVQFPNGNKAATPLVDEAIRTDPGIYPTPDTLKKIYTFPDLPAKVQRLMTRSWTKIKSGK
jgi:putrescine transport system substrate-binding protein